MWKLSNSRSASQLCVCYMIARGGMHFHQLRASSQLVHAVLRRISCRSRQDVVLAQVMVLANLDDDKRCTSLDDSREGDASLACSFRTDGQQTQSDSVADPLHAKASAAGG
jgi:hypothetical protein